MSFRAGQFRALGTSIRWASVLKAGYKVPTHPRIEKFLGWGVYDTVVDVPVVGASKHHAARIAETVQHLGLKRLEAWDRFGPVVCSPNRVVFCTRSSDPLKDWLDSKWMRLGDLLSARGLDVEYQSEGTLFELEDQLKTARLVVGVDSGPLHLADYMGIDTVGLYGFTSPYVHGTLKNSSLMIHRHRGVAGIEIDLVEETILKILDGSPQKEREIHV